MNRLTSEKWAKYPADVLPFFVAEMDFPLAPPIANALRAAVESSDCGYAYPRSLREAFPAYAIDAFGLEVQSEDVFVVADVMAGVTETLNSLTQRGDAVVINPPVYPPYYETVRRAERRIIEVPLVFEDERWQLDWSALERAFADGARVYLMCHPHNPVGRSFDRMDLIAVAALAAKYDVLVISDEIFAELTYAPRQHVSFMATARLHGVDAVWLVSASKAWNIGGLKCALAIASSDRVRKAFERWPAGVTDRIGQLGVIATQAAFTPASRAWFNGVRDQLDENRRLLHRLLAEQIPEIEYHVPEATYLAWLDCRKLGLGDDPSRAFLERGRVALSAGPTFGDAGRGYARFNFGTTPENIAAGVDRMASVLQRR